MEKKDYWNQVHIHLDDGEDIDVKPQQYLDTTKRCTLSTPATKVATLKHICLKHIHQKCVLSVPVGPTRTYFDYTRQKKIIEKINLPTYLKLDLWYHSDLCPLHGNAVYEISNTYRSSKVYVKANTTLFYFLRENKILNEYELHQYHTRSFICKRLLKRIPDTDLVWFRTNLFTALKTSLLFPRKFQ